MEKMQNERVCRDGGVCFHKCVTESCERERYCEPLTGSGLDDNWKRVSQPVLHAPELQSSFESFKFLVKAARPDLDFTFTQNKSDDYGHKATWMFKGAKYGGSVGRVRGTNIPGWGITTIDIGAWIEFEKSHGREPRWE